MNLAKKPQLHNYMPLTPFLITPHPTSQIQQNSCDQQSVQSGYAYTKDQPDWGWAPGVGESLKVDGCTTTANVFYIGNGGDGGCGVGSVTIPTPARDQLYRFNQTFPSTPPAAGKATLKLSGFQNL